MSHVIRGGDLEGNWIMDPGININGLIVEWAVRRKELALMNR